VNGRLSVCMVLGLSFFNQTEITFRLRYINARDFISII
jgi:hypothetical protein